MAHASSLKSVPIDPGGYSFATRIRVAAVETGA
jgi:hypothetical protein